MKETTEKSVPKKDWAKAARRMARRVYADAERKAMGRERELRAARRGKDY